MSSRYTVDTTYLRIRNVFAFNANSGEVIPRESVPVIGDSGHLDWKNSFEFLSSLSVPTLSTTVLDMLSMIQPGFSSLSTIYFSTTVSFLTSTVQGLGSLPDPYVSTSKLYYEIDHLGSSNYVSSTTLYDCISHLGNLSTLNTIGFVSYTRHKFDRRGYVSTINPGEYKIYQSTLRLQGANLNTSIDGNRNLTNIDIGGYIPHIVSSSKMRIDINTNITTTGPTTVEKTLSTFITADNRLVGSPVVVSYSTDSFNLPYVSFILNRLELVSTLQLKCSTNYSGTITTLIPTAGGIHITLDNTD